MPYLTNLADISRRAGLETVEVAGWKTRGHGVMGTVQTITCHHTANGGAAGDAPSLNVVRSGRPGLSGPLAHYVLGRSGKVYVVAAGLCWHAGTSRLGRQTNSHAIGIEAEAIGIPGAGGDWPDVQMNAYARLCRALMAAFSVPVEHVQGHRETCSPAGRKTDPSFDMGKFRARIEALGTSPAKRKEPDMSFQDKHTITQWDLDSWGDDAPKINGRAARVGDEVSYAFVLRNPPAVARLSRETATEFAKLRKLIEGRK